MTSQTSYGGLPVRIDGVEHLMPAMTVRIARDHWERIERMQQPGGMPMLDQLDLTIDLVTACLQRNYPGLTREQVSCAVDLDNYDELNAMTFGRGSWMRWVEMRAALAEGNAPAAPQTTDGTGEPPAPASSLPPGGASPTSMH